MIRIGKIVATHGISGTLIFTHVAGSSTWLKKDHVLYIEMQKGSYIPHFITSCKAVNDSEYHISIESIDKIEGAKKLVTKHVYADEAILAAYARQSPLLWIGFTITDNTKGNIGTIDDVVQTGKQWLARLTINGTEVLIPLIEQTIVQVDIKAKNIKMELPDGLLEIYLGE